ncbi:NlpC/P60 family protein [Loktanella sp. SALINAS62]|uniref:NlpC/P60 family protein n=1 Tax=Loktanella sp. SALINAS62 TaxID=2706124 RepID=UPI001B8D8691|nr:NlpC/P60 family protein [Loktanella sp. SALINAS62]MBS1301042.1 C40 family peptidase [Loktanella sp. SALINAS62]
MTDHRLWPANDRVALQSLGLPDRIAVDGTPARLTRPVTDLCRAPDGPRERQLLLGDTVTVLETRDGWAFVQTDNGYCGYVPADRLDNTVWPTHRVGTFATHAYAEESMKSQAVMALPFGARLRVLDERAKFFETPQGFVPKKHLRPLDRPFADPVTVAQLHFNVPYLWGGNSTRGLDCSGLIHAALTACDIPCPGDADLQENAVGEPLSADAPLQRGDLLFWVGHVGLMVDAQVMIHANGHAMACTYEPVNAAILRIQAQDGGEVTQRRRLTALSG